MNYCSARIWRYRSNEKHTRDADKNGGDKDIRHSTKGTPIRK
jgi:hypothetical protein